MIAFNRRLASQVRKRTTSLADSEQNFRAIFEMASVGVAQVDLQAVSYKKINKKYSEIVGYSINELNNLTPADITHSEDIDYQQKQMQLLLEGQIPEFTIEKRYVQKNGTIVWALLTMTPLWIEGQKPVDALVVIRDITVRKNAEERLVFARKVFENSIEGIVVTDAKGTIMQINAAFTTITGYTPDEAIGKNPRILKSDKHSPDVL